MCSYNDAHNPTEFFSIVSAATAYDHQNDGTNILLFNESLYYGMKIQHSLINPNQVRFHGLNLFDNLVCDDELYIEVDNETDIPLQFKETKCVFKSRVPTSNEFDSSPHYDMTNNAELNLQSIYLRPLCKISEVKIEIRTVYKVKRDTVYAFPSYNHTHDIFSYSYPSSYESILIEISPSVLQLKEL